MKLISEDYLMHHGVKGMKWGVRHDPERVGRSSRISPRKQYKMDKRAALMRYAEKADKLESSGKGNDLNSNMKIASEWDADRKKAKERYLEAKRQKATSKYVNKAKAQADYLRKTGSDIKKNGDWDDKELFDSLSPSEKKAEMNRAKKVGASTLKNASYWDKAVKDIYAASNRKEAKNLYKKYRKNAPEWVWL